MTASFPILASDPRIEALRGKTHQIWDIISRQFVNAATVYIPFGCPDWGQDKTTGARNHLCTFCALPNAVTGYREAFYDGAAIPSDEHVGVFGSTLRSVYNSGYKPHTLLVFNAGSFLAMPPEVQEGVVRQIVQIGDIRRLVVESRAELVTAERVNFLADLLASKKIHLTIRIGVETQDDHLRMHVLKKGHKRDHLMRARDAAKKREITLGGYVLLSPAPGLDPGWAIEETLKTFDWILGEGSDGLNFYEAYFCSTNVGPGTPLEAEWRKGNFSPASLWAVYKVLRAGIAKYKSRIHLLEFRDEPPLLSVPSNHVSGGIPQDLTGASDCDRAFYRMFDDYRRTFDPTVLVPPVCSCKPAWA